MEYISSDTNVWIDFATIDRLELPFRLPFTYLMNRESVTVMGTIGVLDQLKKKELIDKDEYIGCLSALQECNGGRIRLPEKELKDRIELATKEK